MRINTEKFSVYFFALLLSHTSVAIPIGATEQTGQEMSQENPEKSGKKKKMSTTAKIAAGVGTVGALALGIGIAKGIPRSGAQRATMASPLRRTKTAAVTQRAASVPKTVPKPSAANPKPDQPRNSATQGSSLQRAKTIKTPKTESNNQSQKLKRSATVTSDNKQLTENVASELKLTSLQRQNTTKTPQTNDAISKSSEKSLQNKAPKNDLDSGFDAGDLDDLFMQESDRMKPTINMGKDIKNTMNVGIQRAGTMNSNRQQQEPALKKQNSLELANKQIIKSNNKKKPINENDVDGKDLNYLFEGTPATTPGVIAQPVVKSGTSGTLLTDQLKNQIKSRVTITSQTTGQMINQTGQTPTNLQPHETPKTKRTLTDEQKRQLERFDAGQRIKDIADKNKVFINQNFPKYYNQSSKFKLESADKWKDGTTKDQRQYNDAKTNFDESFNSNLKAYAAQGEAFDMFKNQKSNNKQVKALLSTNKETTAKELYETKIKQLESAKSMSRGTPEEIKHTNDIIDQKINNYENKIKTKGDQFLTDDYRAKKISKLKEQNNQINAALEVIDPAKKSNISFKADNIDYSGDYSVNRAAIDRYYLDSKAQDQAYQQAQYQAAIAEADKKMYQFKKTSDTFNLTTKTPSIATQIESKTSSNSLKKIDIGQQTDQLNRSNTGPLTQAQDSVNPSVNLKRATTRTEVGDTKKAGKTKYEARLQRQKGSQSPGIGARPVVAPAITSKSGVSKSGESSNGKKDFSKINREVVKNVSKQNSLSNENGQKKPTSSQQMREHTQSLIKATKNQQITKEKS